MIKRIITATICFTICFSGIVHAAMDDMLDRSLYNSLSRMEELYASGKWDEAMEVGRGILKDAPKNHKASYRAQDLIVLSLDGKNKEILLNKARRKKQQSIDEGNKLAVEGMKLLAAHNYRAAADKLSQSVKIIPGNSNTYYELGYSLLKIGSREEAYEALHKCLELDPNHSKALFHIAGLSFEFNKSSEAEDYTKKLISLLEGKIDEYTEVFMSQKAGKFKEQAMETSKKIAAAKENLAKTAYMNGMLAQKREDYKTAINSYVKALKIKPDDSDIWFKLGSSYMHKSIYHQATLSFEQCVSLRESALKMIAAESKRLLNEGLSDEAVDAELRARKLRESLANAYYMLALSYNRKSDNRMALVSVDKALEIKPDFWVGRYTRAMLLSEKGMLDDALDEMRDILKDSKPNSKEARKAISTITALMDKIAKRNNPDEARIALKPAKGIDVNEYAKDMPGLGGKEFEASLENVFPKIREVKKLIDMRNYAEASRVLIYLKGKHPEIAEIHSLLASCYNAMGRYSEAESCYRKTLDLQSEHPEALNGLAFIWASRGEHLDTAFDYIDKAVKLDNSKAEYWHTHGWVLFRKGELRKSIESYKKALGIKPDYMQARYDLGLAFYLVKGYGASLESFDSVLSLNPTHQKALLFKSICQAKMKDGEGALATLGVLKETLDSKSRLAAVVKDFEQKITNAQSENVEIPVPEIKTTVNIDRLLAAARDYKAKHLVNRAKEKYLECQRLAPDRYEPYNELGQMYAESGLNKAALSSWVKAAELSPKNYDILMNIGKMQHKIGRLEDAKESFSQASKAKPKDAEPVYYLGLIAYEGKNFETSSVYAKDAIKLKRNFFKAMALLGMSQVRLDKLEDAKSTYESLYAKAPANSSIKGHARMKIWEIAKALKPNKAFPSYEKIQVVKKDLETNGSFSRANNNKDESVLISITPGEEELVAEYGKNTMTPNDKERVLKLFNRFGAVKQSNLEQTVMHKNTSKEIADQNKWFTERLKRAKSGASRFSLPDEVVKEEHSVKVIEKTHIRVADKSDPITKQAVEYMKKGFVVEAAKEFARAKEISPDNIDVLLNLGFFNTLQGNFKDAFDAYAHASMIYPDNDLVHLGLGNLYWLGGQGEKAIDQWKLMSGDCHNNEEFSAMSHSKTVWQRVLEIDPLDMDAHSNLGIVYMFSGAPDKALAEFQAVSNIEPDSLQHDYYRAQMYVLLYVKTNNKYHKKEAEKLLQTIAEKSESFPHSVDLKKFVAQL